MYRHGGVIAVYPVGIGTSIAELRLSSTRTTTIRKGEDALRHLGCLNTYCIVGKA